jgi:uncharacterized protein (DUF1015 family)
VPTVSAFRALRYSPEVVPDLARVVAPPYDVISPEEQRRLLARDPRNVVRLDLPPGEPGDVDPDERYRRAGRLLREWRGDGTLRRDVRPSLYPYEQTFRLPGDDVVRVRRGIFATLGLEPFGPGSGVRPHERTMSGPKEDRYRLLRATNVNTSPVVGLYEEPSGRVAAWLDALGVGTGGSSEVASDASPVDGGAIGSAAGTAPAADVVDDDRVRHRLWAIPLDAIDPALPPLLGASPVTIADGHHRYETALRYAMEQRHGRPDEQTASDAILALLLEPIAGPVAVLATHRVVRHLGDTGLGELPARLPALFEVETGVSRERLLETFRPGAPVPAAGGRFGLWTRVGGSLLRARRDARGLLRGEDPAGVGQPPRARTLDVSLLGAALELLFGIDAGAVDAGARIAYTKDAAEALAWVDAATDGADAAFLLDPTPAAAIAAVAAEGDVMPQKSTYIYPKALTGLVINPLE